MTSQSMSDLRPDQRVHSEGRADTAQYANRIATSTAPELSPAIEAMVQVAMAKYRHLHSTTVRFLARGGTPGNQTRSSTWRESSERWATAQEMLAAGFAVLYPKADRPLPLAEVTELIRHRTGPLCSGWTGADGALHHHPDYPCDQHGVPDPR